MNKSIEIILNFRELLLSKTEILTVEELNFVPENCSNNIAWNLGHLNAVMQALCDKSSQLPITIGNEFFFPFLPGTKPSYFMEAPVINTIRQQLITAVNQLNTDLESGLFKEYHKVEKIETVYKIKVEKIDDALKYITHHEGIHLNAILNLKKIITRLPL